MLDSFIRGGQTIAHKTRMAIQMLKISIAAGILGGLMMLIMIISYNLQKYHYQYMWGFVKAVGYDVSYVYRKAYIILPLRDYNFPMKYEPKDFYKATRHEVIQKVYGEIDEIVTYAVRWGIISSILISVCSIILMMISGALLKKSKHIRGAVLLKAKELKKETRPSLISRLMGVKPLCIGNDRICYPSGSENLHTLIMGSTGVGKTVATTDLLNQIRERGESAIILDLKGTYIERFYDKQKDVILNPLDKRCPGWNLMSEVENYGHIKALIEAFIPHSEGKNELWNKAAREGFTGIVDNQLKKGNRLSNQELVEMFLKQNVKKIAELAKGTYASSVIDMTSPETAASVVFNLSTHITGLRLITAAKGGGFSIRRWYKERKEGSCIFISGHSEYESILRPLQTAWWEVALKGLISEKRKERTWIILDELGALYRIPSFTNTVALAREYNGCIIACMQDIAQIRSIYGREESKTISSNFGTRCFFKTNDAETAEWISKDLGYQEIEESSESMSYGAHSMRDGVNLSSYKKTVPIVNAAEMQYLEIREMYIKMFGKYPAIVGVTPLEKKSISQGFVESDTLNEKILKIKQDVKEIFDGRMGLAVNFKEDQQKNKQENKNAGQNSDKKVKSKKESEVKDELDTNKEDIASNTQSENRNIENPNKSTEKSEQQGNDFF